VVADGGWKTGGSGGEIVALVTEKALKYLKAPPVRIALPDTPAPASSVLEECYYPRAKDIVTVIKQSLKEG